MLKFEQRSVCGLEVREASAIAPLGGGRFVVVDDARGVYFVEDTGLAELIASREDHRELRDLEGCCLAPNGDIWVLSERTSAIYALARDGDGLGEPSLVAELKHIAKKSNKGWEGMTIRRAEAWPDQTARLVTVHEGKPRAVGVFDLATFDVESLLELPKATKKVLADVSDLTVDPETDHLLLLSDESHSIAEVQLVYVDGGLRGLELLDVLELDVGKKEKPEGLCFDEDGALWVVTDGDAHLRSFVR